MVLNLDGIMLFKEIDQLENAGGINHSRAQQRVFRPQFQRLTE